MVDPVLIADIGGTNARFALVEGAARGPLHRVKLDSVASVAEAIAGFLAREAPGHPPRAAVLAVAGPVAGNRAWLTNRRWLVDGAEIAAMLGIGRVQVVNDFAALAWSLPELAGPDLLALGGGAPEPGAPMAVLGPGTGLGIGGFLPPERALVSEGGHASLAAHDAREAAVIERLRTRFGHVSAERVLSGQGIENLHAALAEIGGLVVPQRSAAEITAAGLSGECPLCREVLDLFCTILGGVAGDLALLYGARGGVFVAGGICPRFPEFLAASAFRARFEAKGRFGEWLAPVPAWLVLRLDAAMLGLAALARRL
ncbi:glucokinase [Siccirubricoccus sp. G192]|uniref:glucokinase n=1 Tax=Siccirubricoccus sp. G192 TaxID=2849651 RepID=UPI001C2CAE51|nr:glucokinase [Siccirubricoccus sp. G192]MBV1795988.1 glucokinase [Siccirubricoccus sp. G192]